MLIQRRDSLRVSWKAELSLSGTMQRICSLIHLTLFWAGVMSAVVLVPQKQVVTVSVGESVTLKCSMEGDTISKYYMYWYRKTQDNLLTFIYREGNHYGPGFQNRFHGNNDASGNQAVLEIHEASLRDEGSYYCVSERLGSTGLQFIFGTGTQLIMEPKSQPPTKPSIFLMKNGTKVACLVKDFYPKDVIINLESSKKITEFDPTVVLAANGKYSAVKLGQYEDPDSVTCSVRHNNELLQSTDFELKSTSSGTIEPTEPEEEHQSSESCYEPKVQARKVNMMSLKLLGLRVLFAKSVAINFLLTAKLLFF
ncbi:immunoglobulin lambda-1 light chain-like [Choloepus didactylus]|uniref:immunoglobulin lambda-1 light chain-like n=1 Tax=Choloepus didactylus TaxID=27675 RepID=UPI00189E8AFC|nr:immunoglobulin lambda-1 light chain-like [Choloepus didactylus]